MQLAGPKIGASRRWSSAARMVRAVQYRRLRSHHDPDLSWQRDRRLLGAVSRWSRAASVTALVM